MERTKTYFTSRVHGGGGGGDGRRGDCGRGEDWNLCRLQIISRARRREKPSSHGNCLNCDYIIIVSKTIIMAHDISSGRWYAGRNPNRYTTIVQLFARPVPHTTAPRPGRGVITRQAFRHDFVTITIIVFSRSTKRALRTRGKRIIGTCCGARSLALETLGLRRAPQTRLANSGRKSWGHNEISSQPKNNTR